MKLTRKIKIAIETIPCKIINILKERDRHGNRYIKEQLKCLEEKSSTFYSVKRRPKYSKDIISIEKVTQAKLDSAIILQGPLEKKDDFTYETVKIYEKLYPGVMVIISTWNTEDRDYLARLNSEKNCIVVENELPKNGGGMLNINYQIISTMAGIRKAKELGKKYVLKSRCDWRFYKKGLIDFFVNLLEEYPVDESISYQSYRFISCAARAGSMFNPFWIADQFNFGEINDMLNYWNCSYVGENISRKDSLEICRKKHYSWKQRIVEKLAPEPVIVMNYLSRNEKKEIPCNVKEYWELVKKQLIMFTREEVGYYWNSRYEDKYDEAFSVGDYYQYDSVKTCYGYNWNFGQWLSLYKGDLEYDEEYEKFSIDNKY